jgi:hypothetical protein
MVNFSVDMAIELNSNQNMCLASCLNDPSISEAVTQAIKDSVVE